jgi:uncharacterized membrane protein
MSPRSPITRLDSNLAAALAYLFGCVTGIAFLLVERDDKYVRFHAMQSTLAFLAVLIVALILGSIPIIGWLLSPLFFLAVGVAWLVLMFKAFTGQRYKLPYVGEIADQQTQ